MGDKLKLVRKSGFSVLPNAVAQDPRLNFAAKGLFWTLFSLPDNWDFSISGLAQYVRGAHGNGKDAIRKGLENLEAAGYLLREQRHDENGKFAGNTIILYDESQPPSSGFPSTVFPSTGNPTEINNNKQIPPKVPQGGRRARSPEWKEAPDWKPERFERFWTFYPHEGRKDKQKAIRAWDKLKPDDGLLREMGIALQKLMATEAWQRGIGIPYASTFLNGRRWLDAETVDELPDEVEEVAVGWT